MVLVDNNILSALAKIGRLEFLRKVFPEVITVPSVIQEINKDAVKGYKFVERINKIKSYEGGWLKIASPDEEEVKETEKILRPSISFTDAECIAVAKNRGKKLLTDDKVAGKVALENNLKVWDFKFFLRACIRNNLIESEEALNKFLEDLEEKDRYKFPNKDRKELIHLI